MRANGLETTQHLSIYSGNRAPENIFFSTTQLISHFWIESNDGVIGRYRANSPMRFKAIMLKSLWLQWCVHTCTITINGSGQMQQQEMQMQEISKQNSKIVHHSLTALPKQIIWKWIMQKIWMLWCRWVV